MAKPQPSYYQSRRLRRLDAWRGLIRETHLHPEQMVMPLFVRPGQKIRAAIPSLPGQFQFSIDQLVVECGEISRLGIPAVLLFGLSDRKDEKASRAYAKDGIIQEAVRAIKSRVAGLSVITDVCLCAYTTHGHCGILKQSLAKQQKTKKAVQKKAETSAVVQIDAPATGACLAKTALSHAKAGADMVAPSDMMDGTVFAIRSLLDASGYPEIPIMAYAAKYASSFYGPFRQAVDSAPSFGDRRSYQLDNANSDEALRKTRQDIDEGADIVMVKPALAYLDIIRRVKDTFHYPVAAFNVSGEYAMVKAASARGWIAERPAWMEMLLAMKRAGADVLITYWAKEAAKFLREQK